MRFSPVILILALAAGMVAPPVGAAPRDFKLCSAAVQTCDCPLQARGCVPVCHVEPLIACTAT